MGTLIGVKEILTFASSLQGKKFDTFFAKIQRLRLQKVEDDLIKQETKLISQIKSIGLSRSRQMHYEFLIAKRDAHEISDSQMAELIKMTDEIEKNDTIRLKKLAQLAELKKVSLPELTTFLNLRPHPHG